MPACLSCHSPFADYKELAVHIAGEKKGHRKGKKWASRYLLRVKALDRKVSKQDRDGGVPLTEEQQETKSKLFREVSGEVETVLTVCPHCKQGHQETLMIEFSQGVDTWKGRTGLPVVMCSGCRER